MTEFLVADMAPTSDQAQYGNEEGLSVLHYLIKMLNQILTQLDRNSRLQSIAVIMSMIDWSQAFDHPPQFLSRENNDSQMEWKG